MSCCASVLPLARDTKLPISVAAWRFRGRCKRISSARTRALASDHKAERLPICGAIRVQSTRSDCINSFTLHLARSERVVACNCDRATSTQQCSPKQSHGAARTTTRGRGALLLRHAATFTYSRPARPSTQLRDTYLIDNEDVGGPARAAQRLPAGEGRRDGREDERRHHDLGQGQGAAADGRRPDRRARARCTPSGTVLPIDCKAGDNVMWGRYAGRANPCRNQTSRRWRVEVTSRRWRVQMARRGKFLICPHRRDHR